MHNEVRKIVKMIGRHLIQIEHLTSPITYLQHFDVTGNYVKEDIQY
jgi:hypothetical protein